MSDFKLKVIADTQTAERGLKQVGEVADKATKPRSLDIKVPNLFEVTKTFQTLERDVKSAANTINTFYKVGKALPGSFGQTANSIENVGKSAAKSAIALNNNNTAAEIFGNTIKGATTAAGQLVTTLAKVGLATFAIKETVGVLQAAFNGFFNNTIGREIKLRETILKTQTTLASTNKVFKDGKEITDPYQKIVTLTGAVRKNIDSIRERSIALAGVTSGEVIEVFGMVASQVGQIGGGLKEAEDLAINFAAALGTFGIPLYQARQEIGSILRGDITTDSYLAKALGITNEDIANAKTKTGGVVKFLEERLSAAVAGQRIAAQGFSGVVSNIRDLSELIGQSFGSGLLDPLLSGLTAVFETLFRIRKQIFDIASKAGETVGRVGTLVVGLTAGRTGVGKGVDASAAASAASSAANKAFSEIESVAQRTVGAIATVITSLKPTVLILADAFRNVVEAFVQIKVGTFEALASALANVARAAGVIAPIFASIFNLYARFLNTPIVKYFAEVATVLALLKRTGLDAATSLLLFGKFIISSVIPALGVFGTAAGAVVGAIAAIGIAIGQLVLTLAGLASALVTPAAAIPAVAAAFQALSTSLANVGNQAIGANTKLAGLSKGLTALGATAQAAGKAILTSLGWILVFQVGLAVVVDAVGRFQRVQENQKASARATEALRRLQTTYKDVGDDANSATKAARDFELAIVNAQYDRGLDALEKVRERINQIRYELKPGIQSWGEFWAAASGEEMGRFGARAQAELRALAAEEAKIKSGLRAVDAARDRKLGEENVKLEAQKRVDLSKEYAELQRQQQNDLFQQRQALAQKEVEIFRAAGELRIYQMEQANAKLIEGEEGASRAALEALNNYLSVRENGELEIEAAKKGIAIEVANLQRQIEDYKFENAKKIAEIQKRAGENAIAMANAQRQAAGQPAADGGGGAATFGATGNVKNAKDWVHGHFQTNSGTRDELISDVLPVLKELLAKGIPVELSNGTRIAGDKDDSYYRQMLTRAAQQHGHSGDGRSIDLFVPEGTKVPVPLTNISGNKGRGGITGGLPGSGKSWVGHLAPGSKAGGAAPPTPALQSLDVAAPSIAKYEAAVRGLGSAMERLRALQAALTEARTASAFEAIAKAAFPKVSLEGYQDSLAETRLTYDAIAASSANAFDPERTALAVQANVQIIRSNTELAQINDQISQRENLSAAERTRLIEQTTEAQKAYVASVREAERLQTVNLVMKQAGDYLKTLKDSTQAIYDEVEATTLRNKLQLEGMSPQLIEAALNKVQIEKDTAKQLKNINEELNKELALRASLAAQVAAAVPKDKAELQQRLDAAMANVAALQARLDALPTETAARTAAEDAKAKANTPSTNPRDIVQTRINDLKREAAELTNIGNRAVTVADGIGSAFSTSFKGIIDGSMTARQALGNFFQSLADMFLEMAAQMIAKMVIMAVLNQVLGVLPGFSGGGGFGGGYFNPMTGKGAAGPNFGFAKGGAFAENGIIPFAKGGIVNRPTMFKFAKGGAMSTGVMGEAGPEAIMPLSRGANGKLGVLNMGGGGGGITNVTVNVDASGSKVQGDNSKGDQLGRAVSQAVQDELLRQKRPGGLLS